MAIALSVIGVLVAVVTLIVTWPELKKWLPIFPRPLIRISYQVQDDRVAVVFDNTGNAPAGYFTADIRSAGNTFSAVKASADFHLTVSGKGGTWTIVSGRDMLPQQKGMVLLSFPRGLPELKPPKVRSDARYRFVGTIEMSISPEQELEDETASGR